MSQNVVLLVHPEASIRALLTSMLQKLGCHIEEASNDRVAVRMLEQAPVDLVLAACESADPEALELLAYLHRKHPKVPCVMLFTAPHPDRVRVALNWGAASVLRYPLPAHALRAAVAQALGLTESAPSAAPRPTAAPHAAYVLAAAPAGARTPALALTNGPAAVTPPACAEVVGQERSARAQGGTLYLDEVTALRPELQSKLLRVIQDVEHEPVDSDRPGQADVRFVLATREDLVTLVEREPFRADLSHGISVTSNLPPLRHRDEDVVRLAEHCRARFASEIDRAVQGITTKALEMLRDHDWQGSVLELENTVERVVVRCRGAQIEPCHLERNQQRSERPAAAGILPLKEALEGPERQLILEALEALNGNRQKTAQVLGINRTTLYKKMKKYGLCSTRPPEPTDPPGSVG
jgi:DNA-binding NtrC family response regulator